MSLQALSVPSLEHMALASVLVKSKPYDQTMEDYLRSLKTMFQVRDDRTLVLKPESHWIAECSRLRNELERSRMDCISVKSRHAGGTSNGVVLGKRTNQSSAGQPSKRAKTTSGTTNLDGTSPAADILAGAVGGLTWDFSVKPLDLQGLAISAVRVCTGISDTIAAICSNTSSNTSDEDEDTDAFHRGIIRALAAAFQALEIIDVNAGNDAETTTRESLAFNIVATFRDVLRAICRATGPQRIEDVSDSSTLGNPHIALLSAFFSQIDPTKQHHEAVFEGFMYHLLEMIGPQVSHYAVSVPVSLPLPTALALGLSQVVKVAMSRTPRSYRPLARQASRSKASSISEHSIVAPILEKLQRSLVACFSTVSLAYIDADAARLYPPEAPSGLGSIAQLTSARKRSKSQKKARVSAEALRNQQCRQFYENMWEAIGWGIIERDNSSNHT